MFKPQTDTPTGRSYVEQVNQARQVRHAQMSAGVDYKDLVPYPDSQPCDWKPESLRELRAIVQGKAEGLRQSLATIGSDATMGVTGAQWEARRAAYLDCLALIDALQATQRRIQRRSWLRRMTDALGFTPHD